MNVQHKELAAGRWNTLPLVQQMAHIGSEVSRALQWKRKNNSEYAEKACMRALELLDLSLADPKNQHRLKEFVRVRETLADYFWGTNEYSSSESLWASYFSPFSFASRRHC